MSLALIIEAELVIAFSIEEALRQIGYTTFEIARRDRSIRRSAPRPLGFHPRILPHPTARNLQPRAARGSLLSVVFVVLVFAYIAGIHSISRKGPTS